MSPLRGDVLQIGLGPDQVSLGHLVRRMTLRGRRSTVITNGVFNAAATERDAAPWSGAVHALGAALADHTGVEMPATVFVSNQFVRYVLVPWSDSLSEAAEMDSYARHCFSKMYGDTVGQWELRISPDIVGTARLASAMDPGLLSALRGVLAKAQVRLQSVQPSLMAIYNELRRDLKSRDAWFAFLEPGSLCLLLLERGHWARVRCIRIGADWREELPLILEREAYLADTKAAPKDVFLCATGLGDVTFPDNDTWQIHVLTPKPQFGITPGVEARLATGTDG